MGEDLMIKMAPVECPICNEMVTGFTVVSDRIGKVFNGCHPCLKKELEENRLAKTFCDMANERNERVAAMERDRPMHRDDIEALLELIEKTCGRKTLDVLSVGVEMADPWGNRASKVHRKLCELRDAARDIADDIKSLGEIRGE